jgi:hypothetical protein
VQRRFDRAGVAHGLSSEDAWANYVLAWSRTGPADPEAWDPDPRRFGDCVARMRHEDGTVALPYRWQAEPARSAE